MALLGLPGFVAACTPKGAEPVADAVKAEVEEQDAADAKGEVDEVAPSTAIEPEPAPPDTGMDDGDAVPPPLPAGAEFCFGLEEAASIAASEDEGGGIDADSQCPRALALAATRDRVAAWSRRTGGPWRESVRFVASDTPEGAA